MSSTQFRKFITRAKTLPLHFSARERSWQSKIWKPYFQSSIPITKVCLFFWQYTHSGLIKALQNVLISLSTLAPLPRSHQKWEKAQKQAESVHLWNIHQFIWFISFILEFSCFSALLNEPLQCSLHRAALEEYSEATIVHNALGKGNHGHFSI